MTELEWTGERLVTELENEFGVSEHLHRYAIAMEFSIDKTVLDIASGEGYGSTLISKVAKKVYGVDIDAASVNHSNSKYGKDNLSFLQGSGQQIPLPDDSVDVITSFETLEHLIEHDEMMAEFKRVLKTGGKLLISTPEKSIYHLRDSNNPYHLKELTLLEFKGLLKKHFSFCEYFKQRLVVGSLIMNENEENSNFRVYDGGYGQVISQLKEESFFNQPFFNIAICSDTAFKSEHSSSFFSSAKILQNKFESMELEKAAISSLKNSLPVKVIINLSRLKQYFFKRNK